MAKKHKPTSEFSPRAKRIYDMVRRGVAARTQGPSIMRGIDAEIEKIKVGSPDPELKKEIRNLEGLLAAAKEGAQASLDAHIKVEEQLKGKAAGWEGEHKKIQEEYQKLSKELDTQVSANRVLMEEIALLKGPASRPLGAEDPSPNIPDKSGDQGEDPPPQDDSSSDPNKKAKGKA